MYPYLSTTSTFLPNYPTEKITIYTSCDNCNYESVLLPKYNQFNGILSGKCHKCQALNGCHVDSLNDLQYFYSSNALIVGNKLSKIRYNLNNVLNKNLCKHILNKCSVYILDYPRHDVSKVITKKQIFRYLSKYTSYL